MTWGGVEASIHTSEDQCKGPEATSADNQPRVSLVLMGHQQESHKELNSVYKSNNQNICEIIPYTHTHTHSQINDYQLRFQNEVPQSFNREHRLTW